MNFNKIREQGREKGLSDGAINASIVIAIIVVAAVVVPALAALNAVVFWIFAGYWFGAAAMTFAQTWACCIAVSVFWFPFWLYGMSKR